MAKEKSKETEKEQDTQKKKKSAAGEGKTAEPEKKKDAAADAQEEKQQESTTELSAQLEQANEKFLRLAAEYDNYRRRTSKEKEDLYAMSKLSVISEFLPVIDNLDRALDNKTDNIDEYKKGVEMIGKQFYETLKKLGAEEFGTQGDAFDPELHNAVMHIDDDSLGEGVIAAVFSKGYRIGGKVIRHAMVQVAN